MIGLASMQGLVDIGFVLLVTIACWKSLINDNQTADAPKKTKHWKHELKELQQSLRQLISEASTASYNLDKNLLKRQEALTALLEKLDSNYGEQLDSMQSENLSNTVPVQPRETVLGGLPNSTWVDSPRYKSEESSVPQQPKQQTPPQAKNTLPNRERLLQTLLNDSVEVIKEEEPVPVPSYVPKNISITESGKLPPAHLDPTAYKVALRLLKHGVEIHRVARKLDLPLTEVRRLDIALRAQSDAAQSGERAVYQSNQKGRETTASPHNAGEELLKSPNSIEIERSATLL